MALYTQYNCINQTFAKNSRKSIKFIIKSSASPQTVDLNYAVLVWLSAEGVIVALKQINGDFKFLRYFSHESLHSNLNEMQPLGHEGILFNTNKLFRMRYTFESVLST